jgi:iron complex transport system substrate-binding protein
MRVTLALLGLSVPLLGCAPATPDQAAAPAAEVPASVESTPAQQSAAPADTPVPAADPRFTIQADAALQAPLAALYAAFYEGEQPVFVSAEADLVATASEGAVAYFLPGAALIPAADSAEVADFIAFAISPVGQQVMIDQGALPATITLTDQAGNAVEVAQPVHRMISAHGPTTAFVYAVGAQDRLVAASYLGARDPQGAAAMERIDPRFEEIKGDDKFSQQDFNVEDAAALDPDLILAAARTTWLDVTAELDIPAFLFDAETPERLKEAMLLTGQLFGPATAAQAEAWVAYYDSVFETVIEQTRAIPEEDRVRVLFTGTEPLRVASGEMYQTAIIEAAGGVSVTAELTGFWNDVNLEQVAIWNPDVIIVPPYGGASVEAITESPDWQILEAVQAGRVYRMPKLVVPWDTPAPDSVLGIIWMAQLLYPDLVDLDCAEQAEYFYNTFYHYAISAEETAALCAPG